MNRGHFSGVNRNAYLQEFPQAGVAFSGTFPSSSRNVAYVAALWPTPDKTGPFYNPRLYSGSLPAGLQPCIMFDGATFGIGLNGIISGSVGTYTFNLACDCPDGTTIITPQQIVVHVDALSLCHFNGTNGSTSIVDATGRTWTVNGDAAISTAQAVFGGASLHNSTGGIRSGPDALLSPGTGDFKINFRFNPTTLSGPLIILDARDATHTGNFSIYTNGTQLRYYANAADRITGPTLSPGTWYAIELTRVSGTTYLFVNGTQQGSTYVDSTNYTVSYLTLMERYDLTEPEIGYMDEFRYALEAGHTAGYTVEASEFTS
jgi:hypothetical protein